MCRRWMALALCALLASAWGAEEIDMDQVTEADHPRIILTDERVNELKSVLRTDTNLQRLVEHLEKLGDFICTQPPVERKLVGTKRFRLLSTSRLVLSRTLVLGTLYRLDGQAKWRERLVDELKAVCAFEDWYPKHFLDTAEMSAAVALGYDWLYRDLAPQDRDLVGDGLVRLGVKPGVKGGWWVTSHNNWNQVCHCGMVLAALAVAEDAPEQTSHLLQRAKAKHVEGLKAYAPAGVYPEGPGYWNYGTSFSVLMASALESVLGEDWGILARPGFRESFDYRMHVQSPTGKVVNYADGGDGCASSPYHFYLARRDGTPGFSAFAMRSLEKDFGIITGSKYAQGKDRKVNRLLAMAVAWYVPDQADAARPLGWVGAGESQVHVAFMRSSWDDPKGLFASLKGGELRANHGHLDAGSFVVEADGVRWAADLGSEKEIYDRNDSWSMDQDSHRWWFFRANNYGHNTLTIDGQLQRVDGASPIIATGEGDSPFAIADLSAAYVGQARSVKRGVMMPERKVVLVRDEITGVPRGKVVRWNVMTRTRAEVSDDGRSTVLHAREQTMRVKLLSPADGRFAVMDATPERDDENPNEGWQRLVVDTVSSGEDQVISVLFVPSGTDAPALPNELGRWPEWNLTAVKEKPVKKLPLPGEVFTIEGHTAFLILPEDRDAVAPVPWVWYAPTLPGLPGGEERWMFERFLAAGIGVAGVDVGESFGRPAGVRGFSALHRELVRNRGMSPKPGLLARSRGGLMLYNWATENAGSVGCIAGIYPVCNLASYPGLGKACGAYGMSKAELTARLGDVNPIERLAPLADAGVPIFHIHGDSDKVVPLDANSATVKERYAALGGEMELEVVEGGGHDMNPSWFRSGTLVSFMIRHLTGADD